MVQVEMFGVSMNSHGTMFYGMQVEAVLIESRITSFWIISRLLCGRSDRFLEDRRLGHFSVST